jgi:hypothetical protein
MSIRDSAVDRSEHEILIAKDRQYKITGVDKSTPGKTVIYAEYLP